MKSKLLKFFLTLSLALVFIMGSAFAEVGDKGQKGNTLNKPLGTPIRAYMNINFISTIIKNDGIKPCRFVARRATNGAPLRGGEAEGGLFLKWGRKGNGRERS